MDFNPAPLRLYSPLVPPLQVQQRRKVLQVGVTLMQMGNNPFFFYYLDQLQPTHDPVGCWTRGVSLPCCLQRGKELQIVELSAHVQPVRVTARCSRAPGTKGAHAASETGLRRS